MSTDLRAVTGYTWRNTSPSQISSWRLCHLRWWHEKPGRVDKEQTASLVRGTSTHAVMEDYTERGIVPTQAPPSQITLDTIRKELAMLRKVRAADVPEAEIAQVLAQANRAAIPLLRFVPSPEECKERGVLSERLLSLRYDGVPVPIVGKVDLTHPQLPDLGIPGVDDYKTTSDFKYQKTPEQARADVQAITYGYATLRDYNTDRVRVRFLYTRTSSSPAARETTVVLTSAEIDDGMAKVVEDSRQMAEHLVLPATEVPFDTQACGAYGGCPHRGRCQQLGVPVYGEASAGLFRTLSRIAQSNSNNTGASEPHKESGPEPARSPAMSSGGFVGLANLLVKRNSTPDTVEQAKPAAVEQAKPAVEQAKPDVEQAKPADDVAEAIYAVLEAAESALTLRDIYAALPEIAKDKVALGLDAIKAKIRRVEVPTDRPGVSTFAFEPIARIAPAQVNPPDGTPDGEIGEAPTSKRGAASLPDGTTIAGLKKKDLITALLPLIEQVKGHERNGEMVTAVSSAALDYYQGKGKAPSVPELRRLAVVVSAILTGSDYPELQVDDTDESNDSEEAAEAPQTPVKATKAAEAPQTPAKAAWPDDLTGIPDNELDDLLVQATNARTDAGKAHDDRVQALTASSAELAKADEEVARLRAEVKAFEGDEDELDALTLQLKRAKIRHKAVEDEIRKLEHDALHADAARDMLDKHYTALVDEAERRAKTPAPPKAVTMHISATVTPGAKTVVSSSPCVLFIGCAPQSGGVPLEALVAGICEQVAEAAGVEHYALIRYEGSARVAALLKHKLKIGEVSLPPALVVDAHLPMASACLEVLTPMYAPQCIVRRF